MVLARTIYVFIKLLPSIWALKKDRVLWINQEKRGVDEEQFKKHARRIPVSYTHLTLPTIYSL